MTKSFAIGASLLALGLAVPANAAFVLDTNGGNGFVTQTADGFVLTGSADGSGDFIDTTYTTIVRAARTVTFRFNYATLDSEGSVFDPAGYVLNGVFTQLSDNNLSPGDSNFGFGSVEVLAGDNFGFYVTSIDNLDGPGQLEISQLGIPEPATWAFMILGFGFIGGAMRYSRRTTKVAFA